jgi:hypothetical protein
MFRSKYKDRVRFFEACQIIEVSVLTILVFDVVVPNCGRSGWKDRDAWSHSPHEFFTPFSGADDY